MPACPPPLLSEPAVKITRTVDKAMIMGEGLTPPGGRTGYPALTGPGARPSSANLRRAAQGHPDVDPDAGPHHPRATNERHGSFTMMTPGPGPNSGAGVSEWSDS